MDLGFVLRQYESVALHPVKCTSGKMIFQKEIRRGLKSLMHFYCDTCEKTTVISTHSAEDVNDSLVWGCTSIGIGHQQCEELLGVLNIPPVSYRTFSKHAKNVKKVVQI